MAKIAALLANNASRQSWVHVDGSWKQIDDTNFDCVTNMTVLAANAHTTGRHVNYALGGNGKIIWIYVEAGSTEGQLPAEVLAPANPVRLTDEQVRAAAEGRPSEVLQGK